MRTTVYSQQRRGKYRFSQEKFEGGDEHYAVWQEVDCLQWERIRGETEETRPLQLELGVWQYALVETSLTKVERNDEGISERNLKEILAFRPSALPTMLVKPVIKDLFLTNQEIERINRECSVLFRSGSYGGVPHPLLSEALAAMSMKERFGIPLFATRDEMPYKTFMTFRMISNLYAECMDDQIKGRDLKQEAKRRVGM